MIIIVIVKYNLDWRSNKYDNINSHNNNRNNHYVLLDNVEHTKFGNHIRFPIVLMMITGHC